MYIQSEYLKRALSLYYHDKDGKNMFIQLELVSHNQPRDISKRKEDNVQDRTKAEFINKCAAVHKVMHLRSGTR
jgi:hypothetical protein